MLEVPYLLSMLYLLLQLSEDWLGVVMGSTAITQRSSDECAMDQARFKECIFYLTTYASHSHTVSFLVRHMSWVRVCRYIIEKVRTLRLLFFSPSFQVATAIPSRKTMFFRSANTKTKEVKCPKKIVIFRIPVRKLSIYILKLYLVSC